MFHPCPPTDQLLVDILLSTSVVGPLLPEADVEPGSGSQGNDRSSATSSGFASIRQPVSGASRQASALTGRRRPEWWPPVPSVPLRPWHPLLLSRPWTPVQRGILPHGGRRLGLLRWPLRVQPDATRIIGKHVDIPHHFNSVSESLRGHAVWPFCHRFACTRNSKAHGCQACFCIRKHP